MRIINNYQDYCHLTMIIVRIIMIISPQSRLWAPLPVGTCWRSGRRTDVDLFSAVGLVGLTAVGVVGMVVEKVGLPPLEEVGLEGVEVVQVVEGACPLLVSTEASPLVVA